MIAPETGSHCRSLRRWAASIAIVLVSCGCSPSRRELYPGPTLPPQQVAEVSNAEQGVFDPVCYVQFANGEQMVGFWDVYYDHYPVLALPPGTQRLSVAMKNNGVFVSYRSRENCLVRLEAEAGFAPKGARRVVPSPALLAGEGEGEGVVRARPQEIRPRKALWKPSPRPSRQ